VCVWCAVIIDVDDVNDVVDVQSQTDVGDMHIAGTERFMVEYEGFITLYKLVQDLHKCYTHRCVTFPSVAESGQNDPEISSWASHTRQNFRS
jgi:hypothetical protein